MSPMHVATEIVASEPSRAARAPTDVLRLAVAVGSLLVVVLIGALFDEAIVGFVADLVQGIEALPSWLVTAVIVIGQILGIVVLVGGAVVAVVRRNWIVLALAAAAAGGRAADAGHPAAGRRRRSSGGQGRRVLHLVAPDQVVSTMGLAVLAAVVTAASPWIARRWRRAGWTVVIIATLTRFLGAQIEFDTLVAVLTGWAAGAAAIVALGAPSRRPLRRVGGGRPGVGRRAAGPVGAGQPRCPWLDALLRHQPGRVVPVREGAGGG